MECKFFPCSVGVRCDAKDRYAIATINAHGQKKIFSKKQKNNRLFCRLPLLRGLFFFIYGMIAFFTSFDVAFLEDVKNEKEQNKKIRKIILYSIIGGFIVVLWLVVLGLLPAKLSFLIMGYASKPFLRNFLIAIVKVGIIYIFLTVLRFLPIIQELYKFNGACNIIYLGGGKQKNFKKDCYANPMNFLNFIVFSFIFSCFVITLIGISLGVVYNWLINFCIFTLCVSLSYEFLNLLMKYEKLSQFCVITSFFVVARPNTTHIELARSAYLELTSGRELKEEMKENEIALSLVRSEMELKLEKNGIHEESDIDWIIATVLKMNRAQIKIVRCVGQKEYREIMKATDERAKGKPLSAIFGFTDFYGLRFFVNKKVLSPRMETEILVEQILKEVKDKKKCRILDIGTGSGAIAICLAKYSNAEVTAVDVSKGALEVAKQNAKNHKVKVNFIQSDLFSQLKKKQKYDIIVSNPPYIRTLDIEGLDKEVKNYDPRLALDGGEDGLDFYRSISQDAKNHMNENGLIFYEIGKGQFTQVTNILAKNGYVEIKGIKDYNKIYRIVKAEWKK